MATHSQSTYGNDLLLSTASCGHPGQCGCLDLAIVCCATCPLPRCRWDAPNEHEEKHRRYEIIVRAIREAPDVPKYTLCRELGVSIKTLERARQWGRSEYAKREKPAAGEHRPGVAASLAFAEEYARRQGVMQ